MVNPDSLFTLARCASGLDLDYGYSSRSGCAIFGSQIRDLALFGDSHCMKESEEKGTPEEQSRGVTVKYYQTEGGSRPAEEWLEGLEREEEKARAKLLKWLAKLEEQGPAVAARYPKAFEKLTGTKLFEIRTRHGGKWYRLIFCYGGRDEAIVLHGFTKKSNKTPREDLTVSEDRMGDYLRRLAIAMPQKDEVGSKTKKKIRRRKARKRR